MILFHALYLASFQKTLPPVFGTSKNLPPAIRYRQPVQPGSPKAHYGYRFTGFDTETTDYMPERAIERFDRRRSNRHGGSDLSMLFMNW